MSSKPTVEKLSTGGVVLVQKGNDYDVLVMQQESDYVLPKGHVEPGESDLDAAQREILEETGVSVASAQSLGLVNEFRFFYEPENAVKVVRLYGFLLHEQQPIVPLITEGFSGGSWLSVSESLAKLTYEDARIAVTTAVDRARNCTDTYILNETENPLEF